MAARAGEPREIPLDDVLRFMRLIWAIDHELERVSKRMESRIGLTIPQRMSLLLVGRRPGMLASELAAVLHLHRATMSGIVSRLQAAGYLEGRASAHDGRRVGLTLTSAGRQINKRRAGTFEDAVRTVLASTTSRDRLITERMLLRLGDELRRLTEPPSDGRSTQGERESMPRGTARRAARRAQDVLTGQNPHE